MRTWAGWGLGVALGLCGSLHGAFSAAEYYYRQHDYLQALPLWKDIARREPQNLTAVTRVAELSLWLEGRQGIADQFRGALEDPARRWNAEARSALKNRFRQLQTVFLSDQAQNLVLQAKQRSGRGDWKGALEAYQQAALLDRGHFGILRERAHAERELGRWGEYLETLSQCMKSFPYDVSVLREFAEASLYFRQFDAVHDLYRNWEGPLEARDRLVWAVALADGSQPQLALPLLKGLLAAAPRPPAVVYQALAQVTPGSEDARRWRTRFVDLASRERPEPRAWDPFRLSERLTDARRELTRVP